MLQLSQAILQLALRTHNDNDSPNDPTDTVKIAIHKDHTEYLKC